MTKRIRFTTCPQCASHTEAASHCAHCGEALRSPSTRPLSTLLRAGRSGAIAASLFGLAAAGPMACSEEEDGGPNAADMVEADGEADMTSGGDAASDVTTPVEDTVALPPYGIPPAEDMVDDTPAPPEDVAVAAYGIPPDGF